MPPGIVGYDGITTLSHDELDHSALLRRFFRHGKLFFCPKGAEETVAGRKFTL